jgi:ATP-dependent DNA helicase RecQ
LRLLRKQQAIREDEEGHLTLERPPDWNLALARRRHELDRLDAMDGYARTAECRRGFVLRYFGDPDAMQHCDSCDNCMRHRPSRGAAPGPFARLRRLLQR